MRKIALNLLLYLMTVLIIFLLAPLIAFGIYFIFTAEKKMDEVPLEHIKFLNYLGFCAILSPCLFINKGLPKVYLNALFIFICYFVVVFFLCMLAPGHKSANLMAMIIGISIFAGLSASITKVVWLWFKKIGQNLTS